MTYSYVEGPGLAQLTKEQFELAHNIFHSNVQDQQLMCSISDVFSEPASPNHNCLGCNFDETTDQIAKFLLLCTAHPDLFLPQQSFAIYAMLLNVLWERMNDIFEIISLQEGYRVRYFEPFIRTRRWANFFKHPKAFAWMVHHPVYTFDGSTHSKKFLNTDWLKIDDGFVKSYYSSDASKVLTKQFTGKEDKIVVILPDIESLTKGICDCLDKFIEIITKNQVYQEILNERSTFTAYFSDIE
jgi:hypothetical protein